MTLIDKAEALLNCPFCGGGVSVTTTERVGGIVCDAPSECIGSGLLIVFDLEDMETALAAWNRRALPARGVGVPEAMRQMIVQAVRFANLAAGEGICIDDLEPETFLFDYSQATGDEDWETLPARILAALAPTDASHVNETPKSEHDGADVLTAAALIARLREIQGQAGLFASAAADRIEQLVKSRDAYAEMERIATEALRKSEARVERLEAALVEHNDLLRSALAIAKREGVEGQIASTNWDAYYNRVAVVLKRHHQTANEARASLKGTDHE